MVVDLPVEMKVHAHRKEVRKVASDLVASIACDLKAKMDEIVTVVVEL